MHRLPSRALRLSTFKHPANGSLAGLAEVPYLINSCNIPLPSIEKSGILPAIFCSALQIKQWHVKYVNNILHNQIPLVQ